MYAMAGRLLKRSASLIPDENQGPAAFAMVGTVLPLFGGSWHAADDLRSSIVDSGLSAGHLFDTTLYLVSQGFLRLEQGVFDKSDFCAGTILSIADRYAYEYARVQYHRLRSTR